MRKKIVLTAMITILLADIPLCFSCLDSATLEATEPATRTPIMAGDEGSTIETDNCMPTMWVSPDSSTPSNHDSRKNMVEPRVLDFIFESENPLGSGVDVYVLVNLGIYPSISASLTEFVNDLQLCGYSVSLYVQVWQNASSVRSLLQTGMAQGIEGAILVGNIPAAWYEMDNPTPWGHEEFPIDLYYMDLDGNWTDGDSDGKFDDHIGTVGPEIWVGRIDASGLSGTESQIVNNYFSKNQRYRTDDLAPLDSALVYVDDDWQSYADSDNSALQQVCENTVLVKDTATTNATDYKIRLQTGNYEWVHLRCHGSSGSHTFKIPDNLYDGSVFSSDYRSIDPQAFFYQFFVCSGARFTEQDYLAGSAVFADTGGLLAIGSTKTGSMQYFGLFYELIAQGQSIGEAFKQWFESCGEWDRKWFYGLTIVGDPTLYSASARAKISINIRANGSVEPNFVPIQRDGSLYTLTGNIIGYDGIVVERDNMTLDGAGYTLQGAGSGTGISANTRSNVTISNTEIKGFEYGIDLSGTNGSIVSGNNITSDWISLSSSFHNMISGNNIVGEIVSEYSVNNNICENNIIGGIGMGAYGIGPSAFNSISENNITGFIDVSYLANNTISGNNITGGIALMSYSVNNTVSENNIGDDIYIYISMHNIVSGNNIAHGISGYDNADDNFISGNNITGGISMGRSCSSNTISGNNIIGSGITLQDGGSDNLISGNVIKNSVGYGIYFDSKNDVYKNLIENCSGDGIFMDSLEGGSIVSGNSIVGNGESGIVLNARENNIIAGNDIRTNKQYGIELLSASNNLIYHNDFVNNAEQVYSENSANVWDNGYPSGGNYWSDYTDVDLYRGSDQDVSGSDGIWDHPYQVDENNKDDYPLVSPWTLPSDAYLAVQGARNEIYYRTYNATGRSWESWYVILEGATCDSPVVAVYSGRLYFVVRGMDGGSIWFGSVNLADYSFSGWTGLSGATPSAPTLTVYGSKLILVVRGFTDAVYYRYYDTVSETWGDWIAIEEGATCDKPAAAVLGTNLHLVVRGFSTTDVWGNNTMWHGIVNLTDDSFSGWTSLSGATPSAPTLAASDTLGELYLTVRGMSDVIWINTWNGTAWEGWTALPNGATCDSPAATVVNEELHIVVRSDTGDALWHYYINLSTEDHSGWIAMDGYTPSAPTLGN